MGRIPLVSLAAFVAASAYGGIPGWRAVCFIYGVSTLGAALWLWYAARKDAFPQQKANFGRKAIPDFALLKNRDVFWAMLGSVLNAFSNDRIFTFLPLLLMTNGIDPHIIGSFALGFTVGSFLGKMACGRLVDRFGPRTIFIVAELLLTILICVMLTVTSRVVIVVIALCLGIVTRGTVPVIQAIITEPVSGGSASNSVFSINSFLRGITNMLPPLLFGCIAATWGMPRPGSFSGRAPQCAEYISASLNVARY